MTARAWFDALEAAGFDVKWNLDETGRFLEGALELGGDLEGLFLQVTPSGAAWLYRENADELDGLEGLTDECTTTAPVLEALGRERRKRIDSAVLDAMAADPEAGVFVPCFRCRAAVRVDVEHHVVHVVDGGARVTRPGETTDEEDPGEMGLLAVGPDCARKYRAEGAEVIRYAPLGAEVRS